MKIFAIVLLAVVSVTMIGCAGPGYVYRQETVEYYGQPAYYQPYYTPVYTTRTYGVSYYNNGGRHHEDRRVHERSAPVVQQQPCTPGRSTSQGTSHRQSRH